MSDVVTPEEHTALRSLHAAFVDGDSPANRWQYRQLAQALPRALTAAAESSLRSILSKAYVRWWALQSPYVETFLRNGAPVTGRLWERWTPDALAARFTEATYAALTTSGEDAKRGACRPRRASGLRGVQAASGDLWLVLCDTLSRSVSGDGIGNHQVGLLASNTDDSRGDADAGADSAQIGILDPRCYMLVHSMAQWQASSESAVHASFTDQQVWMLEALQRPAAQALIARMPSGNASTSPAAVRELCEQLDRHAAWLDLYLSNAEKRGRRDLARFVMRAWAHMVTTWSRELPDATATGVTHVLRQRFRQACIRFVRLLDRWSAWQRWATLVDRYDDDFAAAQLWRKDFSAVCRPDVIRMAEVTAAKLERVD